MADMTETKGGLLEAARQRFTRGRLSAGAALLLVLTLALFADVLFLSPRMVLSRVGADLSSQFVPWRSFGFSQLGQGKIPLWNPHIFSGAPFVGGFQSAIFYPLNLIYLVLPLALAINVSIAAHVFLLGFFMYLWALNRGLAQLPALLAALLAVFCGAFFPHIYAGHLPNLSVMPWVPLLFYALDRFSDRPALAPFLLGVLAVAMQILAGHPQYVFYTGVTAGLYLLAGLPCNRYRLKTAAAFVAIYLSAALLSAVQLFTGLDAAADSVRNGVPYSFAAMFSFPFENLLTLLTPAIFGSVGAVPYWGRNNAWEMSLFISITGLFLAAYGAIHAEIRIRRTSLILFAALMILAFGQYTPLFGLLYHFVPGFNKFRGISKFIFQASLFLILLAAAGLDSLLRHAPVRGEGEAKGEGRAKGQAKGEGQGEGQVKGLNRRGSGKHPEIPARERLAFAALPLAVGALLLCLGAWLLVAGDHAFSGIVGHLVTSGESYFPREQLDNPAFLQQARLSAVRQLLWAGGVSLVFALLLELGKQRRGVLLLLPVLAFAELLLFALPFRPSFDIGTVVKPELQQALATKPGDYRILNQNDANSAMTLGTSDLNGYDPMVSKRYAEFITFTQGRNPENPDQYLDLAKYHPLYKMLRFRYFIPERARTAADWTEFPAPMKRLNLVYDYTLRQGRDAVLSALASPAFDPAASVILESNPKVRPARPQASAGERLELIDSGASHLTVKAELSSPAILLITDPYASGWRAEALPGSVQSDYQLLPADYILRAIPLKAGRHSLRIFYQPRAFVVGAWVSCLSLAALFGGCLLYRLLARKRAVAKADPTGEAARDGRP